MNEVIDARIRAAFQEGYANAEQDHYETFDQIVTYECNPCVAQWPIADFGDTVGASFAEYRMRDIGRKVAAYRPVAEPIVAIEHNSDKVAVRITIQARRRKGASNG